MQTFSWNGEGIYKTGSRPGLGKRSRDIELKGQGQTGRAQPRPKVSRNTQAHPAATSMTAACRANMAA